MIVEGVDPQDLIDLALQRGYCDVLAQADDLGGYTKIIDGKAVAIGGVRLYQDGRLWLGLIGPCRPIYHRWALRFLGALAQQGITEVWSYPDMTVPGAEKWLRRLGFKRISDKEWHLCLNSR